MQFFYKKNEEISRTNPGFEEQERPTPITGKILLVLMFFAGLFFGWQAVDDVGRLVSPPPALSHCSYSYQGKTYLSESPARPYNAYPLYVEDVSQCSFSDLEKNAGIPALYTDTLQPLQKQREPLQKQLDQINGELQDIQYQIDRLTKEYGTGLQEKSADISNPLFPTDTKREQIRALRGREKESLNDQSDVEGQIRGIDATMKQATDQLVEAYKPILAAQNKRLRWYEFKTFLLQVLLFIPLFFLIYRQYLRLHRSNSPFTIIYTAMVGVTGVLVLRIILQWFWGLFLRRVLETLWEWLSTIIFFQTIALYAGMVLSFAIFGGAVYYLQKKIFDPQRVTIRRFRSKQCPHCQTNLDLAGHFCPNCGAQIKEECSHCQQARFVGLPACPWCGTKKE